MSQCQEWQLGLRLDDVLNKVFQISHIIIKVLHVTDLTLLIKPPGSPLSLMIQHVHLITGVPCVVDQLQIFMAGFNSPRDQH